MNLSKTQTSMPQREGLTFQETNCGYDLDLAQLEANRCLQCKHQPCVSACPIHVPIPQFIKQISENNLEEAYSIITSRSNFPDFCSRVCHVEHQCQGSCVRAIKGEAVAINYLERFVADHHSDTPLTIKEHNQGKIAVIGSGPSGLACASDLAQLGYQVDVYEKESYAGGIVSFGVPEYRLPHHWVKLEVDKIKAIGVNFKFNQQLGKDIHLSDLRLGYDAVYIAIGEEQMVPLHLEGESHIPVLSSYDYLKRIFEFKFEGIDQFKKVVVVGGGNTAMDCARSARRLGAEVKIAYRRLYEDMPASSQEIEDASADGIDFEFLVSPLKLVEDGLVCLKREVVKQDDQGRNITKGIENSEFILDCDAVILALGSQPDLNLRNNLGLKVDDRGRVLINEDFQTSQTQVYSGGDMVRGADTVVRAIDAGKKAAQNIHDNLTKVKE